MPTKRIEREQALAREKAKDFAEFQTKERIEYEKVTKHSIRTAADIVVKNNPISMKKRADVYELVNRRQFKKARALVNVMAGRDMFKKPKTRGAKNAS